MKINKYTILTTAFLIVSSLNAAWSSATSADWETTKTLLAILQAMQLTHQIS